MKILLMIFCTFISSYCLNSKEPEFKNPPYFIYFNRCLTQDGMMLRYILTTKEIEYHSKNGHKILGPLGTQIIVDSNCLSSIKSFISDYQNRINTIKMYKKEKDKFDNKNIIFYEVIQGDNKKEIFGINKKRIAIDFFEQMLIYIKGKNFHYPKLNESIKDILKSLE